MENGLVMSQCVDVSCHSINCDHSIQLDLHACAELTDPANGNVDVTDGTNTGSVATYSCDDGYTLSGSETRTCEEGGLWSGDAPVCEGKVVVVQCIHEIKIVSVSVLTVINI